MLFDMKGRDPQRSDRTVSRGLGARAGLLHCCRINVEDDFVGAAAVEGEDDTGALDGFKAVVALESEKGEW